MPATMRTMPDHVRPCAPCPTMHGTEGCGHRTVGHNFIRLLPDAHAAAYTGDVGVTARGEVPVPLSEEELRALERMERALVQEDPKLASTLRGTSLRRAARRRAILAGI